MGTVLPPQGQLHTPGLLLVGLGSPFCSGLAEMREKKADGLLSPEGENRWWPQPVLSPVPAWGVSGGGAPRVAQSLQSRKITME